ncbi:MAG: spore maturation protein [Ruminococcaceae bacterium]|nr:spore maturation protein [Oscillospiraceae bacterium]
MLDLLVPLLLLAVSLFALRKKQDVYGTLLQGGKDGLRLLFDIAPALVMLLCAMRMLRASGGLELLENGLRPCIRWLGIPPQLLPLLLIRPLSGSAALAIGADLMAQYGVDSLIGRSAAIVLGSTETTFYTISVYFGAVGIKKTRYAVPAALIADLVGFVVGCFCARHLL